MGVWDSGVVVGIVYPIDWVAPEPTHRHAVLTQIDFVLAHHYLSVAEASEKRPVQSVPGMHRYIRLQFLRPEPESEKVPRWTERALCTGSFVFLCKSR